MVLEALERIRQAEETIAQKKQEAKNQLIAYEQEQQRMIEQLRKRSQETIQKVVEAERDKVDQELVLDQNTGSKQQVIEEQQLEELYEKNKGTMIDYIRERVKKVYGGQ